MSGTFYDGFIEYLSEREGGLSNPCGIEPGHVNRVLPEFAAVACKAVENEGTIAVASLDELSVEDLIRLGKRKLSRLLQGKLPGVVNSLSVETGLPEGQVAKLLGAVAGHLAIYAGLTDSAHGGGEGYWERVPESVLAILDEDAEGTPAPGVDKVYAPKPGKKGLAARRRALWILLLCLVVALGLWWFCGKSCLVGLPPASGQGGQVEEASAEKDAGQGKVEQNQLTD